MAEALTKDTGSVGRRQIEPDGRPDWPYEEWREEEAAYLETDETSLVEESKDAGAEARPLSDSGQSKYQDAADDDPSLDRQSGFVSACAAAPEDTEIHTRTDLGYTELVHPIIETQVDGEHATPSTEESIYTGGQQKGRQDQFESAVAGEDGTNPADHDDDEDEDEEEDCPLHMYMVPKKAVGESAPMHTLLKHLKQEAQSRASATDDMKDIVTIVERTLNDLKKCCKVFKGSYVRLVGSVAENTKIGELNECDFAVMLPALANRTLFQLAMFPNSRESPNVDKEELLELVKDMAEEGQGSDVLENFQGALKVIWSYAMGDNMVNDWQLKATDCHLDYESIAGTFHLQRSQDLFTVDVDICFCIPVGAEILESAPDDLPQKQYLLHNGLDADGLAYAMVPRDKGISLSLTTVRFAMSIKERELLNQYGNDSTRMQCYRLAKCVVQQFVPKCKKRPGCEDCVESLISSFTLKNIVLFMLHNHTDACLWTEDQVANRLLEIFSILECCTTVGYHEVSAFFYPYTISLSRDDNRYSPKDHAMVRKQKGVFYIPRDDMAEDDEAAMSSRINEMMKDPKNQAPDVCKPCFLPEAEKIIGLFESPASRKIALNYFQYLQTEEWALHTLLRRLVATLYALAENDEEERQHMAQDPSWNDVG